MDRLGLERHGSWQRFDHLAAKGVARDADRNDQVHAFTILVVEDEWLLRQALHDELTAEGWHVLEAASGERATSILQSGEAIDLLITDIRLGGRMTGWELARRFRETDADLPVIYLSANSSLAAERVERSLFFEKPCAMKRLVAACHKLRDG